MIADPAILKRIRGCPFARGGRVLVRFRANGCHIRFSIGLREKSCPEFFCFRLMVLMQACAVEGGH